MAKTTTQFLKGILCLGFLSQMPQVQAQVLPVGTQVLEDKYRRDQLLGKLDSSISFMIRPLTNAALRQADIFGVDSNRRDLTLFQNQYFNAQGDGMVQLMPITRIHQRTKSFPYGKNDGGMIPTVGYQTMLSAGVYMKYKFLSFQFNPELVIAQNAPYDGFSSTYEPSWQMWYQRIGNRIDKPERFGEGWYTRLLPGQSSFRLNFEPLSLGISTENLWWGPGRYNSLVMTNTAPGFAHITFNTIRPLRTPVGSLEFQVIGGRLEGSGFTPTPLGNPLHYDKYYKPKADDWRYLSGVVFTYQPKWVKGLTVGFARAFTVYHSVMGNRWENYFPFLESTMKKDFDNPDEEINTQDLDGRDQLASVFARWVIPNENAEVYFEYGRNDHSWDRRDLIVQLEHSRALVAGVRKLVPMSWIRTDDYLQLLVEVSQTEGPRDEPIRPGGPWYGHSTVRHGYTHRGQLIGAGIDPGSNTQTVNLAWGHQMKQIGLEVERYVHNQDFFYRHNGDIRRNWVDYSGALFVEWDYHNFVFSGKMHFIKALNYQYELDEWNEPTHFWDFEKQDKWNNQFQFGLMYRF